MKLELTEVPAEFRVRQWRSSNSYRCGRGLQSSEGVDSSWM